MNVRKLVYTIAADATKDVATPKRDPGPDVIEQARSEHGRILKVRVDLPANRVLAHHKGGTSEELKVVIIG